MYQLSKLLVVAGVVFPALIIYAETITNGAVSLDDLGNQMRKARDEVKWGVLLPVCDQVLERKDAPKSSRAQAKLYRVDALAGMKTAPDKVAEEYARLENDEDFVDLWPIQLRLGEAQYCCSCSGLETQGIKAAGSGMALVRKAMEKSSQKPDKNLWDRMFLILNARIKGLDRTDSDDEAAEEAYALLKEADQAGVALSFGLMQGPLDSTATYFSKAKANDKVLESAAWVLGIVGRTADAVEVGRALARMQDHLTASVKNGAAEEARAKMKAALLAIEKIDFKNKKDAILVIEQAKTYAAKF